ncbi:helix-turn-helix transcriptional regulator [Kribbella solani]|uniref:Putative ArsR family transcriptional regulator n=1 Tax=Kribbella solani TaxID=236067 RepID=A0A841DN33_9ACTN|nr:helix-turn-helix domain-containing protein [Kribbella solani]MBB5979301.1 putative ArsR family transcriptional regulator [Kribbella solani]MDX2970731.1 helix-turn-helix domain-containing protein [Kribbella solani]MDX3003383.1 helix-turn-helix domain-containing protein [Kribbella solani]
MDISRHADVQAVAVLEEPTRRRLYEYVVAHAEPISRDDAASALGIPRTTAAFHLDRLTEEGLLETCYERRTGRTGPGAGRPAKLYHRSDREIEISLPERQYAIAGQLLAAAIQDAEAYGISPREAVNRRAREYGETIGRTAGKQSVEQVLAAHGFEPRAEADGIVLANCPFRRLAKEHPQLVCGMNLHLIAGLLTSLDTPLQAELAPTAGHCCVRITGRPPADQGDALRSERGEG